MSCDRLRRAGRRRSPPGAQLQRRDVVAVPCEHGVEQRRRSPPASPVSASICGERHLQRRGCRRRARRPRAARAARRCRRRCGLRRSRARRRPAERPRGRRRRPAISRLELGPGGVRRRGSRAGTAPASSAALRVVGGARRRRRAAPPRRRRGRRRAGATGPAPGARRRSSGKSAAIAFELGADRRRCRRAAPACASRTRCRPSSPGGLRQRRVDQRAAPPAASPASSRSAISTIWAGDVAGILGHHAAGHRPPRRRGSPAWRKSTVAFSARHLGSAGVEPKAAAACSSAVAKSCTCSASSVEPRAGRRGSAGPARPGAGTGRSPRGSRRARAASLAYSQPRRVMVAVEPEHVAELDHRPVDVALGEQRHAALVVRLGALLGGVAAGERQAARSRGGSGSARHRAAGSCRKDARIGGSGSGSGAGRDRRAPRARSARGIESAAVKKQSTIAGRAFTSVAPRAGRPPIRGALSSRCRASPPRRWPAAPEGR